LTSPPRISRTSTLTFCWGPGKTFLCVHNSRFRSRLIFGAFISGAEFLNGTLVMGRIQPTNLDHRRIVSRKSASRCSRPFHHPLFDHELVFRVGMRARSEKGTVRIHGSGRRSQEWLECRRSPRHQTREGSATGLFRAGAQTFMSWRSSHFWLRARSDETPSSEAERFQNPSVCQCGLELTAAACQG